MINPSGIRYSFAIDRLVVVFAYFLAVLAAYWSTFFVEEQQLWFKIALADFIATAVIFIFSMLFNNSSLYDPYWSVIPPVIFLYIFAAADFPFDNINALLAGIVLIYWAIRLTLNWLRTWNGLYHQDWRYTKMATDTGKLYWPVSFLGIHLVPTIIVYLACLPMIPVIHSDAPLNWIVVAGFIVSMTAAEIERRADKQLHNFKTDKNPAKGKVCNIGLWKYSRHPNYFGEILFWAGLFIISIGTNPAKNIEYGAGLLGMIFLFVFISIPMMEKRQMKKEGYAEYKKQVPMLVPWFSKKPE